MVKDSIRKIYRRWGLNQDELGELLGLKNGIIASYLKKQKASLPSVETMLKLEKLSGLSVRQLWEDDFRKNDLPEEPNTSNGPISLEVIVGGTNEEQETYQSTNKNTFDSISKLQRQVSYLTQEVEKLKKG